MSAKTRLSAKGQVVIPKDVRDALGMKPGQVFDVVPTGGGVWLKPETEQKSGETFEVITARIRARMEKYKRPPMTLEQIDDAIAEGWRGNALRGA